MVVLQQRVIERLRAACQADERVTAALMYGSFTTGEGDAWSDVEAAIFVRDDALEGLDQRAWLQGVSPVGAYFVDDFGHRTALFENGVRGEFHFMRASEVSAVAGWRGYGWFPSLDAAVLIDRTGELSEHARLLVGGPPERGGAALVEGLALNLVNLTLFGANLLNRGEMARAWALLGQVHVPMLKLVRLLEGATDHWPTPSRALEGDVSEAACTRYRACTANAESSALWTAYRASWRWSRELLVAVAEPLGVKAPEGVMAHVDALLAQAPGPRGGA